MAVRLTSVDEHQFLTCLERQVWGSKTARFRSWGVGDHLVFLVEKAVAGLAEVAGEPYVSREIVWDNGIFPHRIPIKFVQVMLPEHRPPVLGDIRDALMSAWGPTSYGWGILNQQPLPEESAKVILAAIRSCSNDLPAIQADLEQLLAEAKVARDASAVGGKPKGSKGRGRPRKTPKPDARRAVSEEPDKTPAEELVHASAQDALIQLGRITGCLVWIASNDRNRTYKGRPLGEQCLETLPNFGLNKEAADRISYVDVIWVRQSAPLCAFEVEVTTSIYSGLLRMSDLLALVPALNVKLYVVAPRQREGDVMRELDRPTFRKIGLSEFCRFVASEDLESLLSKVHEFRGHVQPTIVDTIAHELEGSPKSALG